MKKFLYLCMAMVMLFTCAGCGKKEEVQVDPVQDDLKQYVESTLPTIKNEENAAITRYNEVCEKVADMKRDEIVTAFSEEIIPTYTTFYNNLQNVSLATTQVQEVKELYVSGADLQLQGLEALAKAIESNDSDAASAAQEQIAQGKEKIAQHRQAVVDLANAHNVTIE